MLSPLQALENCVCILHNLTYQFECEVPETIQPVMQVSRQSATAEAWRPGCLVMRNARPSEADDVGPLFSLQMSIGFI